MGRSTLLLMAFPGPRLTIPTRIFLSIVLVLVFFGAASAVSLYQHQRTAQRLRLLEDGYLPLAMSVSDARASHSVFEASLGRLLEGRDAVSARWWIDGQRRVRPAGLERMLSRVRRAESLDPPAEDARALLQVREHLKHIRLSYGASEGQFETLHDALEREDDGQAQSARVALLAGEAQVRIRLRGTWLLVQSRVAQVSRSVAEQEQQFVYVITAMAFVAMLVGLVVLWWSHRLLAPLPRLQSRVARVAKGDFTAPIEPARDDEIGQLTLEFERMVEAVGARDRQLREAAAVLSGLQKTQEQIVAGLRAGVVVIDGSSKLRSANRAAAHVLGVGPDDIDRPYDAHAVLSDLKGLADAIETVAGGGEGASLSAAPLGSRSVDVLVTPFEFDEDSAERRSVLVVAEDVTEALETKARLIQTERLAAIGRMAAHVSHEVRNPLSSIGLNVELLEEEFGEGAAEPRALLRSIHREIDRLTGVTEEYLRLARLPMPRLENEQLGEIVDEVGRFVAREFETSLIRLHVDVAPGLPLVAADEPQIRQALLNLLRNARESMPEGGRVDLEAREAEGGIEILVTDRGAGIPREKRLHIFDLFYSTKERGSGLGLPLTQQIVSAHGGTIACDDAEGGGTVFTMWLPRARDAGDPLELAAREE